jgi:DNA-binding transcriptional MocR family regulator
MSEARRAAIAGISRRHNVQIIEDDIYSLLPTAVPPPLSSFAPEISWYLVGTAKSIAPGLKTAYVVGPDRDTVRNTFWPGVRGTYWMCAPINAAVATMMIEGDGADRLVDAARAETRARQYLVSERLADRDYRTTPETLQVWLTLSPDRPRQEFIARVRANGAEIGGSDDFWFGTPGEAPNAIRFGTGTPPTREMFERGLQAITDAFTE